MVPDEDFHKAWDRVARTPDGHMIYLHLQKRLMGTALSNDTGALLGDNGERRFAASLIALMRKGIEESVNGSDRLAVIFKLPEPKRLERNQRGNRLIGPEHHVPGWDDDARPTGVDNNS